MLQLGESRAAVPQDPVREGNLDIAEARKTKCFDEIVRAVKHSSVTEKQYAAAPSTGLSGEARPPAQAIHVDQAAPLRRPILDVEQT